MNKKRLLCIVLSLTAVFSMLFIKDSAAWIDTETGAPLGQRIVVNKLDFELKGKLGSYLYYEEDGEQYVISDQNFIIDNNGKISGINNSTVDTDVRWRVIYDTPAAENIVYAGGQSEDLLVEYDSGWTYNAEDGYFHMSFAAVPGGSSFNMINKICYNGEVISKDDYVPEIDGVTTPFEGKISIQFQAKQKDFVEWTDIFTITTP